jgi:hypothetical protein
MTKKSPTINEFAKNSEEDGRHAAKIYHAFLEQDSCEIIFPKQSGIPPDFLSDVYLNNCI